MDTTQFRWMMISNLGALALAILALASCSTTVPVTACPSIATYDRPFQDRLAGEVAALPPGSALGSAMVDYGALRAIVRACHG